MSNTSGIISEKDVLQIGDSKAVLSADKNNTSYLCTYSTINPWSTYKPINYPAITREDCPLSAFAHTGFKTNSSFQIVYVRRIKKLKNHLIWHNLIRHL